MTYSDAIQFLYGLRLFGAKLGLENTRRLAELAGNPHLQLRFIHVAGTNGKGSTCAMLESIYRAAGLRVGLFTSPHLVSFRERIQVNRKLISEDDVVRLVTEFQVLLKQFPIDHHPTFFEVVTVMALRYFAEQKCDLVIWETGLGGRLDATNIVTPLASVITNIGLDHQQWLGDTIEKIASEKAGIIKSGVPVLTAAEQPEALQVIKTTAKQLGASFTHVKTHEAVRSLIGSHQQRNAALAVATVHALQDSIPINEATIESGLANVKWPGRMQMEVLPNGSVVLLDGAHNIEGAHALAKAVKEIYGNSELTLVLGIFQDKNWREMCVILAPLARRILTVPVASERTADPIQLRDACHEINPKTEAIACASLTDALDQIPPKSFILIAGSLYLIGEAIEILKLEQMPVADEKSLNEWTKK